MEATTVTEEPGTVTVHVSNQSFVHDPVHIRISIDGEVVVDDDFLVGHQDNWSTFQLAVAPGDHEFVMTSSSGVTQTEGLNVPAGGHRWVAVGYWSDHHSPGSEAGRPRPGTFTMTVADEPMSLM